MLFAVSCLTTLAAFTMAADPAKEPPKIEIRCAEEKSADGLTEAKVRNSGRKVYLHKDVVLTNKDIKEAKSSCGEDGIPKLELILTAEGGKKLGEVTGKHNGKPMAILIKEEVVLAPTVRGKVGDRIVITGAFTEVEAERLAKEINAK